MWLLAAVALGLMLVRPWAPAAEEQQQPKKAEEQAPQPKAPEAPAPQVPQEPQKAQEPTQSPTTPEAPPAPALPPAPVLPTALDLPPGVACNNTPAAASDSGKPKKLNPCIGIPEAIAEGRTICPGCHGMGGGGMCPSVMDDQWKFGVGDDETVFKMIKGTYPGQTMPNVFGLLLKDEQIWKIVVWIRSIYKGDPDLIVW
jgi:hypothetical protein